MNATVTQLDSRRTAFAVFAADIRTRNYKPADAEFVIFLAAARSGHTDELTRAVL